MEDICQVLGWHLLWLILYLAIHGEPGNYNSDRKYMSSDDSCKLRVESWGGGGGGMFREYNLGTSIWCVNLQTCL